MDKKWWYLLGFLGIIAFFESDKNISMSGVKQRRSKRLYFISNDRTIPHDQVDTAKRMARAGYGKIHAVWAYSADEARELIRQGKAETLGGLGETKPLFVRDITDNRKGQIVRVVGWEDKNPIVVYPGKTGGMQTTGYGANNAGIKEPYKYVLDSWRPVEPNESWNLKPGGGAAMEMRIWHKDYLESLKETEEPSPFTVIYDSRQSEPKAKMIPESRGQMTLFGGHSDKLDWNKAPLDNALDWYKTLSANNVLSQEETTRAIGMLDRATRKIPVYGDITKAVEYIEKLYDKYFPVSVFIKPKRWQKEMTPAEKVELEQQLYKADTSAKKEKIIPEKAGQMTLFGGLSAAPTGNEIYMQSSPITKELQRRFDSTTFSPYDLNKDFNDSVANRENEVSEKLSKYGITEIPADIQTALAYYRKSLYEFLVTKANQVPGPMVTGPSKYNYRKLEKSIAREDKAIDSVSIAKEYLRKALDRNTKGRRTTVQEASHNQWKYEALHTPKKEFANKVFQSAYDKANPNLRADYDAGVFVTVVKNKGRKYHAELIDEAIREGLEIDPIVKKDYPEKFGLEKPKTKARIKPMVNVYEELRRKQEESERIAEEWGRDAKGRIEVQIKRIEERKRKPHTIPEQTTMFKIPSQMTLFGGARL